MNTTGTAAVKLSIEVIALPVGDVERALRFYVDQVGFTLDVDYSPNDAFRVVQLTPHQFERPTQPKAGKAEPRHRQQSGDRHPPATGLSPPRTQSRAGQQARRSIRSPSLGQPHLRLIGIIPESLFR